MRSHIVLLRNTRTTGPDPIVPPQEQASSFAEWRRIAGTCALLASLLLAVSFSSYAQQPTFDPIKVGNVVISGSFKSRVDAYDWFEGNANNEYGFSESLFRLAVSQSTPKFEWKIEVGVPLLYGLPSDAVTAAPQGQFGFGGSYYAANKNTQNTQSIFPKQVYGKVKFGSGNHKGSILAGRSEFFDGAEVTPKDPTLAALERDRIAQRLIGNFAFSDVGRSFDGGVFSFDTPKTNITVMGSRPTRGVFQVDGWNELQINLAYGAVTHQFGSANAPGQIRVFIIGYNDFRTATLKTDNRSAAVRTVDRQGIDLVTLGGNYTQAFKTQAGTFDLLAWGAIQGGSWGTQTQRADAYALEAGYQLPAVQHLKPWLRGGYNFGSGDKNPADGTHGTFFQILPTARVYARFPFFNMMNMRDAFGELVLKPSKALVIRSDIHSLALASARDLWYSGGGAYSPWAFGYTGRTSNGQKGLATLYDISGDYTVNPHLLLGLYYGHASGKLVMQTIYPKDPYANLGYAEVTYRF